jgi:hypothetical protein
MGLDNPPVLVVAGTSEVASESGGHLNQACLWMPRNGSFVLEKTVEKVNPATIGQWTEEIRSSPEREIRVWLSGRWAICVLICVDALSHDIIEGLARIGTNLLLVPAMTDRSSAIVNSARRLRTESQAFIAFSSAPALFNDVRLDSLEGVVFDDALEAAFDGPYKDHLDALLAPRDADSSGVGPGLWMFDSWQHSITWHE